MKKTKKSIFLKRMKKQWPYFVMILPGCIYLLIFKYIPMAGSVIAFQDYNVFKGIMGSEWVGLKHFEKLLTHYDFGRVLRNTLVLGVLKTTILFAVPIILALMLNELEHTLLKKSVQTAIYIPHFISWAVVGSLVFDIFGLNGMFNALRNLFDLEPILAMQKTAWYRPIYIGSSIWKESGWGTIVYLAAMSSIDPSFYEAAKIDGASRFERIRYITVPLLMPTVVTLFILTIGGFLEGGFDQSFNLMTPMTYSVGDIFSTYVYRNGILQADYDTTTAIGLFQSVVGLLLVSTANKLSSKVSEGGLW